MSYYPIPRESEIFNEYDYNSYNSSNSDLNSKLFNYVKKTGDIMKGILQCPEISIDKISFFNTGVQNYAFTDTLKDDVETSYIKTQNIIHNENSNDTEISNNLKVVNLVFSDNSTQIIGFDNNKVTDLNNAKTKLSQVSYDSNLFKTTITGTTDINNLICNTSAITFPSDGNKIQTKAFTNTHKEITEQLSYANNQLNLNSGTTVINGQMNCIGGHVYITGINCNLYLGPTNKLIFSDSSQQTSAFTSVKKNQIETNKQDILTLTNKIEEISTKLYFEYSLTSFNILNAPLQNITYNGDYTYYSSSLYNVNDTYINALTPTTFLNAQGRIMKIGHYMLYGKVKINSIQDMKTFRVGTDIFDNGVSIRRPIVSGINHNSNMDSTFDTLYIDIPLTYINVTETNRFSFSVDFKFNLTFSFSNSDDVKGMIYIVSI